MPISHLEHFLLQTDDIDRTCDWYVEVLGFHVGPSPDFKFPVKWLYLGERDVIHVCEGGKGVSDARKRYLGQQSEDLHGSGVIDHVAFRCTGLDDMIARLKAAGSNSTSAGSTTRRSINCSCSIRTGSRSS